MKIPSILLVYICLQLGNDIPVNSQNACTSGYSVKHCPDGWERYRQVKCFKLFTNKRDWPSANKICHQYESKLASVHSKDELEYLKTYFAWEHYTQEKSLPAWIGGFKKGEIWMWTDLTAFDFTDWFADFPKGNHTCLSLLTHNDYFNDSQNYGKMSNYYGCNSVSLNFICQKFQMDTRRIMNTK